MIFCNFVNLVYSNNHEEEMVFTEFYRKFYNQNKQQIFAVGENLVDFDFSKQDLSGANFSTARLSGANFSEADLTNCKFTEANLVEADFSNANLKFTRFNEAKLHDAIFKGADLAHADMNGASLPHNWFQFVFFTDNDFNAAEIMTFDAENMKIIAFGLHESIDLIWKYVENNKSKTDNLGISVKNYDRICVTLDFFEKLIKLH